MKLLLSLALFLVCLTCLQAQPTHPPLDSATLAQQKEYTSIEEALKADPLKVYKLNLYGRNLDKLPEDIFKFRNLQVLRCEENRLTAITPKIGAFTNLTVFDCSSNQLTTLFTEIDMLKSLTLLNCSFNKITSLPKKNRKS